jgi:hypothetical protein
MATLPHLSRLVLGCILQVRCDWLKCNSNKYAEMILMIKMSENAALCKQFQKAHCNSDKGIGPFTALAAGQEGHQVRSSWTESWQTSGVCVK